MKHLVRRYLRTLRCRMYKKLTVFHFDIINDKGHFLKNIKK